MSRRLAPTPLSERTKARARARRQIAPPPARNGHAIKTGAQAHGENLPEYPATVAEIERIVRADCPWIQGSDLPLVSVFCAELTVFRRSAEAHAGLSATALLKAKKSQAVQVRRARVLSELAGQLGLSPAGRYRLGLQAARTEVLTVKPVNTHERALQVAEILASAGALPPLEPEPVAEPTKPVTAEVIELRAVEESES